MIVNKEVQVSVILYSIIFAGITGCATFAIAYFVFQHQIEVESNIPGLIAFLCVLFLVCGGIAFGIYLTHRIVGPIYKLHFHMMATLRGENPEPITFRKRDFFSEIAEPYNTLTRGYKTAAPKKPNESN
jgi:hypothetical protein